jgi:hypothetical protein
VLDAHHFHLVELVLADHATGVTAIAARFGAEAGRVRGQLERQLFHFQDAVAHGIGQGDFRSGNQVLVHRAFFAALGHLEHVFGKLRQLAGAKQGAVVDDVGV